MAETLRELVVALSLDSSNFSRNMMQGCNLIMCPECYSKYCEEEPENE